MNKIFTAAFAISIMLAGCATTYNHDKDAMPVDAKMGNATIAQAESDLKAVLDAGAQWLVIDKATGGKAVAMTKLMEVAKEKAAAGETEEAERIAMHVSEVSAMALTQSKRYAGSLPRYNN